MNEYPEVVNHVREIADLSRLSGLSGEGADKVLATIVDGEVRDGWLPPEDLDKYVLMAPSTRALVRDVAGEFGIVEDNRGFRTPCKELGGGKFNEGDKEESVVDGLIRELLEEMGITRDQIEEVIPLGMVLEFRSEKDAKDGEPAKPARVKVSYGFAVRLKVDKDDLSGGHEEGVNSVWLSNAGELLAIFEGATKSRLLRDTYIAHTALFVLQSPASSVQPTTERAVA